MSDGPDYIDDTNIDDDSELWRRLPSQWVDPNTHRVTSQAFQDSRDLTPVSVFIAFDLSSPQEVIVDHPGYGVGTLTAGDARSCNQGVTRWPIPQNPAHAYIFGNKAKANRRCLASHCRIILMPS